GHSWPRQYVRDFLSIRQPPLLGQYSSRDRQVIRQHLKWMHRSGIDFLVSSWWGQDSNENITLRDSMLPELAGQAVQFTVFYEITILGSLDNGQIINPAKEQRLVNDFKYFATNYFNHPNFLRI